MSNQGLPSLNHLLQQTLRNLCTNSQWMYAVFWRIRPRNYPPPQWETEVGNPERCKGNKRNWNLAWEDGFCNFSVCSSGAVSKVDAARGSPFLIQLQRGSNGDSEGEASFHPELFFKMSHEVYSYGEGLMGKVAADNSHKWVYREPQEQGISLLSPWHGSLDPHPRTWECQFKAGIQTIALVAVEEGLLQLGSTLKIVEDLNFVIHLQRKFNYLQSIPGVFVSHPTPINSGIKRRICHQAGEESLEPSESGNWIRSPDCHHTRFMSNGFSPTAIDQILSSRLGMNGSRNTAHDSASILGIKRPPDMDTPGLPFDFHDYPGYSPSGKLLLSGSYASRPECPSPPKALVSGTQLSGNSSNLLPSMSSLQALLSKLPSVTPKDLTASNHVAMQRQLIDSPLVPQLHATTSSPAPTSTNCGSPPALANPVPQGNKTSPINSPARAVQVRMSSSPQRDQHRSSSPDQNLHDVADPSNTRPITSAAAAASDTLTIPPASNQSRLTRDQISGNYNGSSSAEELHNSVTVSEQSANNNIATLNLTSNNSCTANAAASSATPIMQLSESSVTRNSDQLNNFQHDEQQQQLAAAAGAADVSNNLRRRAVTSLYHAGFKDKLMRSSCTATSLDQAACVTDANQLQAHQQAQDSSYFSFQDALENSNIYDSIFNSEI